MGDDMEHEIHNIAEANRADHRPERRRILAGKLLLNFVSGLRNGEAGSPLRSLMENPHFWIRLDLANGHHIGPGKMALLEAIEMRSAPSRFQTVERAIVAAILGLIL